MSYQQLEAHQRQIHRLQHLAAICGWDQATMMPEGGNDARAEAMAELEVLLHEKQTAPEVGDWIAAAEGETLSAQQQANLHEIRRHWQDARLLPADLVEALSLAGSKCEHAWRRQRKENDWAGFAPNLEEVVRLSREVARLRAEALGVRPYDAMLALYEPGMSVTKLDQVFEDLATWLPGLITEVTERQRGAAILTPVGPFPVEQQKALGLEVMGLIGFDFNHGRLDVSTHPFCGGVPTDVRLTTRYNDDEFVSSLMGIIHETGHARYEQGLPRDWLGQPAGEARSMGVHESQSLFCEMQLGHHPAFLSLIAPHIRTHFGNQPALAPANLERLYNRVEPGFIRVDADEVTYPAHVILRYELERDLMEGRIEVRDIPELWDQKMRHWLGISTAGNYRDGCMQDIHWTDGSFGYFPSYTLGAMTAAQLRFALERDLGEMGAVIEAGKLPAIFDWLKQKIWQQASFLSTDALMVQATGETLSPHWLRRHLEQRYLGR
ncbi:thermostable carboxypeptidase 1 [Aeromonas diversa CDC 2478-85]|uniref:Metal-dependent carboxypeptidase n=1 Tax=Aeromonas diversa CDC 2478-85 TaxID=1268237 RepID=N9VPQ4_9GAMM|nr:carboxypeptidase M32 [Aeromonas diversa]ENY73543.1 thermostable carboxypeptidase 1 [Aeromonas diversa CDC 2478-85]